MPDVTVRHRLLDADGVVKFIPGGLHSGIERFLGADAVSFADASWHSDRSFLTGETDYLAALAAMLDHWGLADVANEIYVDTWEHVQPVAGLIDLVRTLRAEGYGVYLATNQERGRAAFMRSTLGYDVIFDQSFYSCDMGVAKPGEGFFRRLVELLRADVGQILFIDDQLANVEAAVRVGLKAERWHHEGGVDDLAGVLRRHGLAFA